jgi:hypothetical protein
MTKQEAEEILHLVGCGALNVLYSNHFWQRAHERVPGFNSPAAMRILKRGTVISDPQWNEQYGNHTVKVRGQTDYGRITIVVAISFLDDAVCVTLYQD